MPYRDQSYLERGGPRCFCDQPTSLRCTCCHRPRCAEHLANHLCKRCEQAFERTRPTLAFGAIVSGGAFCVGSTLVLLMAGVPGGVFAGLAAGGASGMAAYHALRAFWMRSNRQMLATMVGELPPASREPEGDGGAPAPPPVHLPWPP